MRKTWLTVFAGLLALVLTFGAANSAVAAGEDVSGVIDGIGSVTFATNPVTFIVDMRVRVCEGSFAIGDEVSVPGSFNGWATGATIASDPDGDTVYVAVANIDVGDIQFKFHDGDDWESISDRTFTVSPDSLANIIGPVYFNDDDVCDPPGGDVPVTFNVIMSVKMIEGSFDPGLGETVDPRGSFNGWAMTNTMDDSDGDSTYAVTLMIGEGTEIEYKYVVRNDDGSDTWEDNIGGNRQYTVPTGGGSVPLVYFDDDDVVSIPVTQNILMVTNLSAYFDMGWFVPSVDGVQARGAFNNWEGDDALDPLGTFEYEYLEVGYSAFSGDNFPFKFFIDFDTLTAPIRFPTYNEDPDGHNYEHPAERGDGNRLFVHPAVSGDVGPDGRWFSDINPDGVLYDTDNQATVEVTLTADMTPAGTLGFDANTDTVKISWEDDLWRGSQVANQGAFAQQMVMTRSGMTNTYTLTFDVVGTTHYNMMYQLRFVKPDNTAVNEGGGLGVQNPYRSRFIQPLGPNSFPTTYSAPTDVWDSDGAPLPGETAPFNPVSSVELEPELGQPVKYTLTQNYPNPFNPATRIKYQIPERTHVTLNVYNILGQQVAQLVNDVQESGNYVALFEANTLASGVYFYKLEAGKFTQTMKMLLMK